MRNMIHRLAYTDLILQMGGLPPLSSEGLSKLLREHPDAVLLHSRKLLHDSYSGLLHRVFDLKRVNFCSFSHLR